MAPLITAGKVLVVNQYCALQHVRGLEVAGALQLLPVTAVVTTWWP